MIPLILHPDQSEDYSINHHRRMAGCGTDHGYIQNTGCDLLEFASYDRLSLVYGVSFYPLVDRLKDIDIHRPSDHRVFGPCKRGFPNIREGLKRNNGI